LEEEERYSEELRSIRYDPRSQTLIRGVALEEERSVQNDFLGDALSVARVNWSPSQLLLVSYDNGQVGIDSQGQSDKFEFVSE
jgi:hypothetical protein